MGFDKGEEDVKTLVKALKEKPKFGRLCIYTLNCFGHLAKNRVNLDRMAREKTFPTILSTLELHRDNPRIISEGCNPLISACRVKEYAKQIADDGGVEFCLKQLRSSKDKLSSARVADLLRALCDGYPPNIDKIKELGGEEVLRETLAEANRTKNKQLASSILSVLERMTEDDNFARGTSEKTVVEIVESLKVFPAQPTVVLPALNALNNLIRIQGQPLIDLLKKMGIVNLISNAMDKNSTNTAITEAGSKALQILSDRSDMLDAIDKLKKKNLETVERKNVVALIGNLAELFDNEELLENASVLEKLAKIIKKTTSKLDKANESEMELLESCVKAAAKISVLNKSLAEYFAKNILDQLLKILNSPRLTPNLLNAVNVSLERYSANEIGYKKIADHSKLLSALYKRDKEMAKSKSARAGATAFVRKFARKSEGVKIMNQLGFIPLVCSFISENIKNSPMVIESFDALIAAADHVVSISDNNLVLMADTALLALKDDPENIAVCKKALELLQKLADNSELIRSKLSEYERSSALSKFKNETNDLELKQLVDALKASLKGAKVAIDAEEILKKIEENSSKIEEKQTNEAILGETFNLSEQLVAASAEEKTLEKLRRLGAVGILGASIARIEKAAHSEMRDDVQRNLLSVLNALNADGAQCPKLLEAKFYDSLARMFSAQKASEGLKAEIRKSFAAFSAHRSEQFAAINVANSSNSSAQTLVPLIDNAAVLTQVLLQAPRDSHDGFKAVHGEIDVVVAIIKKHAGNPEVMLAATRLLDLLVSVDGDNRGYFTSTYVESLCRLTKENADNEEFCAAMLGLLNKYENDEGVATLISDLKNWYFNRSLETNLEVLKLHLLGEIYDRMEDEEKYNEVQRLLQRLMHCYDPKNELVDLAAEATKADQEVVKLVPFLLKQQTSEQVKMQVVALIWQMVASGKVERVFYDSGALALMIKGMKEAKSREERIVYIKALSPFLQSKDSAIRGLVQGEINNLLLSSIDMDENARMLLLEDVINGARDDQNNILLSSACLESLLALFEKQTTAEGKARVLHLIANMAGVSEECANTLVTESGLAITLNALEHNMESQGYVAEMTHFTVNLATHHDCVNGLFDAEVDSIMKGVMFQYTGEKDIFHNAQRTIDLMNLSRLDLTPEQHKKWMQRSRVKHFMTELCRALGIMISTVLTKGEREVRTGDTHYDISRECMRILNEFGPSFDEMIETDSSTVLLTLLGKAWLLRSVLMAYTFLVEKDVSARSIFNAPKEIKDTLVAKCGYTAMWDFENKEFESSLCAVRGGITHQSTRVFLDASVEPQTCQELDVVTKEPIGREYTLEDLISWVKLDTEEKDTLRCFNLVLIWVVNNWHLVTITASMLGNKPKDKPFNFKLIELDGEFLATRCGLTWNWPRILDETNGYLLNSDIKEKYPLVEQIKKDEKKGGVHIKVKISGEELRQKRREIKDTLDFSHSNVLTGDEKDSLDFFIDISNKKTQCRRYVKQLFGTKEEPSFIQFNQEEDGDLYFSWGKERGERHKVNMKEVEGVESGKTSKALKKAKSAVEENCFTVIAAGGQENSFQLENKGDREIWVNGLRLVLSTVANRRPADMVW